MTHATLRIIREEHAALSAVLRSILLLVAEGRRPGKEPDLRALRAMLFYVDEFPEKRHHKKESELLFPKLRSRSLQAREMLDRLDADHAQGERAILRLEPTPERVVFDTMLEVASGEYEVHETAAQPGAPS